MASKAKRAARAHSVMRSASAKRGYDHSMLVSLSAIGGAIVPAVYCEEETRDDVLGGIPTTAIAGLFPSFNYQVKAITPPQVPSVQN